MGVVMKYNPCQYTQIPHKGETLAMFRKDPDIGGFIDINNLDVMFEHIAKDPEIVGNKKHLPMWSPASFIARRRISDVLSVHCMVFDVDDGLQFDVHKTFCQYDYIAHTSFSHTEQTHKWRLILPLQKSIPRDEWKFAWSEGASIFESMTGNTADPSCKDPSRAYYIGGCTDETKHLYRSVINDVGNRIKLEYIIPPPKKQRHTGKIKTFNQEEFKKLSYLCVDVDKRLDIATSKGATISGNVARKIMCPRCGRNSVWFYINPDTDGMYKARCNHQKTSCMWTGSITDL